jgi:hypothetical protein
MNKIHQDKYHDIPFKKFETKYKSLQKQGLFLEAEKTAGKIS